MNVRTSEDNEESNDEYAEISEFNLEPLMTEVKTRGGFEDGEKITAVYNALTGEILTIKTLVNSRLEVECENKTVSVSASNPFVSYNNLRKQIEYNLYPERFGM